MCGCKRLCNGEGCKTEKCCGNLPLPHSYLAGCPRIDEAGDWRKRVKKELMASQSTYQNVLSLPVARAAVLGAAAVPAAAGSFSSFGESPRRRRCRRRR